MHVTEVHQRELFQSQTQSHEIKRWGDVWTRKTTVKLATLDFLQPNITRVDFKFNFQIEMHCREIGIYNPNIGQRQFKILPTAQGNTKKKSEKKNPIQNNFNMRP